MKKIIFILLSVVLSATLTYAQVNETRHFDDFTGVKVGQAIKLKLVPGSENKAVIKAEGDIDAEDIKTDLSAGTLKIGLRGSHRNVRVEITLTYKNLDKIVAGTAAKISNEKVLKTPELTIEVGTAAEAELVIDVDNLEVEVGQAGELVLSGMAQSQQVEVSTAGEYDGSELETAIVRVEASSAGKARVLARERLTAEASSGATLTYYGNPQKVNLQSNSGGSIRKK